MRHTIHDFSLKNTSVLITGGAGFIGSNLAHYLVHNGCGMVRVLDNLSTGFLSNIIDLLTEPNFEFVKGDMTNYDVVVEATKNVDVILHHAALGSVPRSIKDPIATNHANVDGFLNVLTAAKENKVKKVVYASSSSVYGDDDTMPKIEGKTGNLLSPYAVTKKANEMYAEVFSKLYSLKCIGLRYFNVFGPRQNPKGAYAAVIPIFIHHLMEGKEVNIFGDGETTRDFTHVYNVIKANLCAMNTELPAEHKVFNIAFGGTVSLNELFLKISKQLNRSSSRPTYLPERTGDIKNSYANIESAKSLLKYKPIVPLDEGLQDAIAWYANNKNAFNP